MTEGTQFCISCGEIFHPANPTVLLCPACGGPPEALLAAPVVLTEMPNAAPRPPGEPGEHSDWQPGDVILDTYEVKHIFTSGGMGLVYRVHHRSWNIDLAMKSPRKEIIAKYGEEDFVREANTWVELGLHPHIVSCYYVRKIDDLPRVFAEFVEGGSLKDWIEDKRLYEGGIEKSLERILDIAIQFAWGLAYAHEQDLVHQDVKPANVLMTPDGQAKVSDFGLAKSRPAPKGRSQGGKAAVALVSALGGTQPYRSPEQAHGHRLSLATDLWSWGVSLLEMFAGERTWAFGEAAAEVLEDLLAHGANVPGPPPAPKEIIDLLRSCFQPLPSERPETLLAVSARLQSIYQQQVGHPYPRQEPAVAGLRADSLNNKAMSLWDLGKTEAAQATWQAAMQIDPHHPEAVYNLGLVEWRAGKISDQVLFEKMETMRLAHPGDWRLQYWLAQIYLEQDNCQAAASLWEQEQDGQATSEVQEALAWAKQRVEASTFLDKTFEGHEDRVDAIAINRAGTRLLSASSDQTLRLWDTSSGKCLRVLSGHTAQVRAVCFSPDGNYALSGGQDRTLRYWDLSTGQCLREIAVHPWLVASVAISQDGHFGLAGCSDGIIYCWSLSDGSLVRELRGHTATVTSLSLSSKGTYLLSSGGGALVDYPNFHLRLWKTATGECLRIFEGHQGAVSSADLSKDAHYFVSGSWDETVRLWDVVGNQCLKTFECMHMHVESVRLSSDGRFILIGDYGGHVRLLLVENGRWWRQLDVPSGKNSIDRSINSICVHPDDRFVYACQQNVIYSWQLGDNFDRVYQASLALSQITSSTHATEAQEKYTQALVEAESALTSRDFCRAAQSIRYARALPGFERDMQALQAWATLYQHLPKHTLRGGWNAASLPGFLLKLQISPNSSSLLVYQKDRNLVDRLVCLEFPSGKILRKFSQDVADPLAWSADGQFILSGSRDEQEKLKLWDLSNGRCIRRFETWLAERHALEQTGMYDEWEEETGYTLETYPGHMYPLNCLELSQDLRWAITGSSDQTLRLWDVSSGRVLRVLKGHQDAVTDVALTADCQYALSTSLDSTLRLWKLDTGRCLRILTGHEGDVNSICLSQDGSYALSGSSDLTLRYWKIPEGTCLSVLEGHHDTVEAVHMSPEGRFAISGGGREIRVWDVFNKQCLYSFSSPGESVASVGFSYDGQFALAASRDETIGVWILDWELEEKEPSEWDLAAQAYLDAFLRKQTPYAAMLPKTGTPTKEQIKQALTRRGKPFWSEEEFQQLIHLLRRAGYSWLRPDGVRRRLEEMAAERGRND